MTVPSVPRVWVSAVVEGDVDEAILSRIVEDCGVGLAGVFGRTGKQFIYERLNAYTAAAKFSPWIILIDLDNDAPCAPSLITHLILSSARLLSFRIAVRAVESWLLADQKEFAAFLGVKKSKLPSSPDLLHDPKGFVVELARNSKRKYLRSELVPRTGSRKRVGPAYTSRIMEFSLYHWDPTRAEKSSESLRRCRAGVRELVRKCGSSLD